MSQFFSWCDENLLSRYTLLLVIVVICLYRYGYPAYQDHQLSKLEDKVRDGFEEYVIKYKINKPIPANAYNLKYSKIDLSSYPKVTLIYHLRGNSGEDYVGSEYPYTDDGNYLWLCWFSNYMYMEANISSEVDALKNVLIQDNVEFIHAVKNKKGEVLKEYTIVASQCWDNT